MIHDKYDKDDKDTLYGRDNGGTSAPCYDAAEQNSAVSLNLLSSPLMGLGLPVPAGRSSLGWP